MPPDPNAQFDQTVLSMIEHSPVGAVPHTPAYRDALVRLYATHQVYADADHKDGHVTVRSLTQSASFQAANAEAFAESKIAAEALESNGAIFDRYLQSRPEATRAKAESFRLRVVGRSIHHRKHHGASAPPLVHDAVHSLFLVPGAGPHPGLPGNYLYGSVFEVNATITPSPWAIAVHDADDGAALFDAPDLASAWAKLRELQESAPFHLSELAALGFRPN
jgi:hypothetical protein